MSHKAQDLSLEAQLPALEMLDWFILSGADECTGDSPINWFEISAKSITAPRVKAPERKRIPPTAASQPIISAAETIKKAEMTAQKAASLEELEESLKIFTGCTLKNTAANTVFADGNKSSRIMIIGETPNSEEDRIGFPFLGKEGELLEKMLRAIGLDRAQDYYMTNILPWRPPGNRRPAESEISICMPFIKKHIELFNPQIIILLGGLPSRNLINASEGIIKTRGKWHNYDLGEQKIPMMAIFHPNYLLRQPLSKRAAWKDLQKIKMKIKEIS
jgi:DNA polymerase